MSYPWDYTEEDQEISENGLRWTDSDRHEEASLPEFGSRAVEGIADEAGLGFGQGEDVIRFRARVAATPRSVKTGLGR